MPYKDVMKSMNKMNSTPHEKKSKKYEKIKKETYKLNNGLVV